MNGQQAQLIARCNERLKGALGNSLPASSPYLPKLAAYLVDTGESHDGEAVIAKLLADGGQAPALLDAVMQCQLLILQQATPQIARQPLDQQQQQLKAIIERFNHINLTIVHLSDRQWQSRLDERERQLATEQEFRCLTLSIRAWQQNRKVKLVNYYRGLPVQAVCRVINIHESGSTNHPSTINVEMSRQLGRVLSIGGQREALALDFEERAFIRLQTQKITGQAVSFDILERSPIKKRAHFRLEPMHPVAIRLFRDKAPAATGQLLNFSVQYMDVTIPAGDPFLPAEGAIYDLHFELNGRKLRGGCWLRACRRGEDGVILGLELMPNAALQHHLQQEVAQLQRKIIQEIKEKFTSAE